MASSRESALVVLVPEADGLVGPFREMYDPSAARGMPAHITVLYPFKPPDELSAASTIALQGVLAAFSGFTFALTQLRRFPGVLYLAPRPDEPFRELSRVLLRQFPEITPYGGAFTEVIPHLTVAQLADHRQIDAIAVELEHAADGQLPLHASVGGVALVVMDNEQGRWQVRASLRLGGV